MVTFTQVLAELDSAATDSSSSARLAHAWAELHERWIDPALTQAAGGDTSEHDIDDLLQQLELFAFGQYSSTAEHGCQSLLNVLVNHARTHAGE
jgi:hypothetical protein